MKKNLLILSSILLTLGVKGQEASLRRLWSVRRNHELQW